MAYIKLFRVRSKVKELKSSAVDWEKKFQALIGSIKIPLSCLRKRNCARARDTSENGNGRVRIEDEREAAAEATLSPRCGDFWHVANILKEKELDDSVVKFFFTTASDGKQYKVQAPRTVALPYMKW